jgi:hypothetical protein
VPFPLPLCPYFRRTTANYWLDDVEDRVDMGQLEIAEQSWKTASAIYLSLPAGCGDLELENRLWGSRVSLDNLSNTINENREHHPDRNRYQGGKQSDI